MMTVVAEVSSLDAVDSGGLATEVAEVAEAWTSSSTLSEFGPLSTRVERTYDATGQLLAQAVDWSFSEAEGAASFDPFAPSDPGDLVAASLPVSTQVIERLSDLGELPGRWLVDRLLASWNGGDALAAGESATPLPGLTTDELVEPLTAPLDSEPLLDGTLLDGTLTLDGGGYRTLRVSLAAAEPEAGAGTAGLSRDAEFRWNPDGQFVTATQFAGDAVAAAVQFAYDSAGHLAAQRLDLDGVGPEPSQTTYFIHDESQLLAAVSPTGQLMQVYLSAYGALPADPGGSPAPALLAVLPGPLVEALVQSAADLWASHADQIETLLDTSPLDGTTTPGPVPMLLPVVGSIPTSTGGLSGTVGMGVGLDAQLLFLHGGLMANVDVGLNTNSPLGWPFTLNVSIGGNLSILQNVGVGFGGHAYGTLTNAEYAGLLNGLSAAYGGYLGPGFIEYVAGKETWDGPPGYMGIQVGGGPGEGVGVYADWVLTAGLFTLGPSPLGDEPLVHVGPTVDYANGQVLPQWTFFPWFD